MKRFGDEKTIVSKTDIEIIYFLKKEADNYEEKDLVLFFTRFINNYPLLNSEASKKNWIYILKFKFYT